MVQPEGVAHGVHRGAHGAWGPIPALDRDEARSLHFEHAHVRERVGPHHAGLEAAAVQELHDDHGVPGERVGDRDQVALGVQDDGRKA